MWFIQGNPHKLGCFSLTTDFIQTIGLCGHQWEKNMAVARAPYLQWWFSHNIVNLLLYYCFAHYCSPSNLIAWERSVVMQKHLSFSRSPLISHIFLRITSGLPAFLFLFTYTEVDGPHFKPIGFVGRSWCLLCDRSDCHFNVSELMMEQKKKNWHRC